MTSRFTATDLPPAPAPQELRLEVDALKESACVAVRSALDAGAAYADAFLERSEVHRLEARLRIDLGRTHPLQFRRVLTNDAGFGLRAFRGSSHVLVWSDALLPGAVHDAGSVLLRQVHACPPGRHVTPLDATPALRNQRVDQEPWGAFLVERLSDAVLSLEPRITGVRVRRGTRWRTTRVLHAGGEANDAHMAYGFVRLEVDVQADGTRVRGHAVAPDPIGDPEALAHEAVQHACEQLEAAPVPRRAVPLVIAGGRGAVWLHEVIGHALEADVVNAGVAGLAPGHRVGPEWLTVTDDPTDASLAGTYASDDEGVAARPTRLIERGRVVGLLTDRFSAAGAGRASTGNGRRASYRDMPLPRTSNLLFRSDAEGEADLLSGIEEGVYVGRFGEACLTGADGLVRLEADRAWMIRSGHQEEAVRPFRVVATPADLLQALQRAAGSGSGNGTAGLCQKEGQALPVGMRAPAVQLRPLPLQAAK